MSRSIRSLSDAVAPARQRHHSVVEAARQWALEERSWLPPDVVALVLIGWSPAVEVASDDGTLPQIPDDAEPGSFWTRTLVNALLMEGVPDWCLTQSTVCPHNLPEAIWRFIDFLAATGRLHPDSDPVAELRRPLRCLGQLGDDGRWDEGLGADPGPCVCFAQYTGPTHGEEKAHATAER